PAQHAPWTRSDWRRLSLCGRKVTATRNRPDRPGPDTDQWRDTAPRDIDGRNWQRSLHLGGSTGEWGWAGWVAGVSSILNGSVSGAGAVVVVAGGSGCVHAASPRAAFSVRVLKIALCWRLDGVGCVGSGDLCPTSQARSFVRRAIATAATVN